MRSVSKAPLSWPARTAVAIALFVSAVLTTRPAAAGGWLGFANNASHHAQSSVGSQVPQAIRWSTPVDLNPEYQGGELLTHYGSPLISSTNVVVLPVKKVDQNGNTYFSVEARQGSNGALIWSVDTDYILPPHDWIPPCGISFMGGTVVMPAAGGTILRRGGIGYPKGTLTRLAFYGINNYNANPSAYNATVMINTPITFHDGAIYFGFIATSGNPLGLRSGLARIDEQGNSWWISAAAAANDSSIQRLVYNCAPAVTADGTTVYFGVTYGSSTAGYLVGVNVNADGSMSPKYAVKLIDPKSGNPAQLIDDGTASPMIGPDGDVYFGVLENPWYSNNDRGWMLHFSGDLTVTKLPGAFGWDNTAALVPAKIVSSYTGSSSYLLLTKYNNYNGLGTGNGQNKVAILDPHTAGTDSATGFSPVMKEVITVLGPPIDPNNPNGPKYEWCINSAVVDKVNNCAVVNSEAGQVFRWDFMTNSLSPALTLNGPVGEAYTCTLVGPDGAVYAINNATLYCCVASSSTSPTYIPGLPPILQPLLPGSAKVQGHRPNSPMRLRSTR
jgi:hypothetical protein